MTRDREAWFWRLKAIESECAVLQLAAKRLISQSRDDPTIFEKGGAAVKDLRLASENLEGTYLIRLFAEFEIGLRIYWASTKGTRPRTKDLLDSIASNRRIFHELVEATHAIREYRNSLVHERDQGIAVIPLGVARQNLCKFLSRLPETWG